MNALPFLLAAMVLAAGCVGKPEPAAETPAAQIEPASETEPETAPSPAPAQARNESKPAATPASTPVPSTEPPAAPAAPPRVDVLLWNGTITGAGVSPPAGPACCVWRTSENTPGQFGDFQVPAGLKGILVELAWSHPQADLDLQVLAADYVETVPPEPNGADTSLSSGHTWVATEGAPGQPDAHAKILITDAEALAITGGWSWRVGAKAAQEAPFRVAVSLYFDAPPGAEDSALATPSDNP